MMNRNQLLINISNFVKPKDEILLEILKLGISATHEITPYLDDLDWFENKKPHRNTIPFKKFIKKQLRTNS